MAISSPLLEASIDGAHGVLLSIQGGSDLGLFEINEAAQLVSNSAAVDANIIFGAVIDDALGDEVRVTVIAAGFDEQQPTRPAVTGGAGYAGSSTPGAGARSPASATWGGSRPSTPSPASGGPAAGSAHASRDSAFQRPVPSAPEPVADVPAQHPAQPPVASYVPAPVAFVPGDEDDDDYPSAGTSGYDIGDGASTDSSRPEAARTAPDKIIDASAPRRRPVVFEEDDDLDVPDFLK
jgi:cell division protein FtsZ